MNEYCSLDFDLPSRALVACLYWKHSLQTQHHSSCST